MPRSRVYSLSIHADYRCRHSGECCSTDWDVPIELPIYRSLSAALEAGTIVPAAAVSADGPFMVDPDLPDEAAAVFQRTGSGHCAFFAPDSRLCIVHRDLGAAALPATCRHFPRLAVCDARGTFITLSHYCPTAASMLFRDDVPVEIVADPPAFPPSDYEGLDVGDDELPPLLHPRMLMDHASYALWEAHMVGRCADVSRTPESVLATLWRDALALRGWRPSRGPLAQAIGQLPVDYAEGRPHGDLTPSLREHDRVMRAVPPDLLPPDDTEGLEEAFAAFVHRAWDEFRAPLNRYVAAKAFASWTAYQGRGIASIVAGIEAALALVRVEAARHCRDASRRLDAALLLEAFRHSDFALNHLAVGDELALGWSAVEQAR